MKKKKFTSLKNSANFFSYFCALENGPKFEGLLLTLDILHYPIIDDPI
jgi:hypothetical protein